MDYSSIHSIPVLEIQGVKTSFHLTSMVYFMICFLLCVRLKPILKSGYMGFHLDDQIASTMQSNSLYFEQKPCYQMQE